MTASSVRPVLRAGYGLGLLLTVVPLADVWLATRPFHPLQQVWRVHALGQLGSALMMPLIGAFVLIGTAILLEDGRALRAFMTIAGAMVLLLSGALVLFARDTAQLRGLGPESLQRYPFTVSRVMLAYATTIWVSAWLCVGTYRVWRRQAAIARRERETVLIVREAGARHSPAHGGGSGAAPDQH